jgi:NAD(P)-dependent dehydrogenase (short-subunit alcohol dehydrogenase family)
MVDSHSNQQVIITGATSGIGRAIALELGELGFNLVLACRDVAQGEHTAQEIAGGGGVATVEVMPIDTSSQASIRAFARQYRDGHARLDVLINNAGMNRGPQPRANSVDGIELTFATNVLGYHLLTRELLGLLTASATPGTPARIVNVASQFASDLDLDDLQFERRLFDSTKAYAQSKACNRLLTWALARRLAAAGGSVTANAMAPGLVVDTGLYRHAPPEMLARLRQRGGRSVAQGADTAVWLASSDEVTGVSGQLFFDRREVVCEFRDTAAEERLWAICEGLMAGPDGQGG